MVICICEWKFLFSRLPFCLEIIKSRQQFNRHLHAQCDTTEGKCRQHENKKMFWNPKEEKFRQSFIVFNVRTFFDMTTRQSCSFYNPQLFALFAYQFSGTFLLSCLSISLGLIFRFVFFLAAWFTGCVSVYVSFSLQIQ